MQWLAGTALIPLVFALAATLGGPWAGLVAAVLVATYPPLIAVTGDLLSEPLGRAVADRGAARARAAALALAGLLLAAAVLTRANLLVLIPVLALAARAARRAACSRVAALVPVAAWSLNVGAPVTTGGGSSLFVGTYLPGDGTLPGAKRALKAETIRFAPELERARTRRTCRASG